MSLIPNFAMDFATAALVKLEGNGVGLTTDTWNEPVEGYAFSWSLIMLFIDFLLFTAIGLWCTKIVKSEYGQREKWYFCLTSEFWNRSRRSRSRVTEQQ